ncbi:MAG TPA: lytic transglycosylase domain-containing protein [Cyclobacteriaceae bacterium]|jgi:hypothetical protein|nr:lytic transglycosylase domain-containing protein [Cyclobacteriaceae bacterium]
MKDVSIYLSASTFVLLLGYITYSGMNVPEKETVSDGEVRLADEEIPGPIPAISIEVPTAASFAGEPVPLTEPDVYERYDKELQVNTYLHSNTLFLLKRANRWLPMIDSVLEKNGIPPDFKYLPLIESALINDVSPKQAVGFWQILKSSGGELGLEINRDVDERYDPLKSTIAASKYLKKAYQRFGNWTLAAASYNCGMAGLDRVLKAQREKTYYDLYLNEETSRYVFRILAIKEIVEHPEKYGFVPHPDHLYKRESLRYVVVKESIRDLVVFAQQQGINYKLLKRHNPWLRTESLNVRSGRSYRIAIPVL